MSDLADFQNLAVATAIGFLIGFEREWRRKEDKARNFAGARTFALVAFVGGLAGLLGEGLTLIAVGLAAVALFVVAAYWAEARAAPGAGGTTEIAFLGAYLLGATATRGEPALAAAGGVGAAILLALKPRITGLAAAMSKREIGALLRFLAISVIVLPILPDQGYGPYEALNPRRIWQFVVLISGLSFLGYWLMKLKGDAGVLLTGVVGGLASSTAATLSVSRLVRQKAASENAAAAAIVAANGVMLVRVAVVLAAVSATTLAAIGPALAAAALVAALTIVLTRPRKQGERGKIVLENPVELKPALFFAALLSIILVASRFAVERFGAGGLYALAAAAGLADVDAIVVSAGGLASRSGAAAILIAIASNLVVKAGMALFIAGPRVGWKVAAAFFAAAAAGAAGFVFAPL